MVGRERVLGGTAHIAASIGEPGVIVHTRHDAAHPRRRGRRRSAASRAELIAALKAAGADADIGRDIVRALWEKFGFLVALSGMTTATRHPWASIRADPDMRAVFEAAITEAWRSAGRAA